MRLYSWSNDCVLKKILNYIPVILMVVMLLFVTACSSKKNTTMSRFWQSFTTRYNVYFNGSEHYKEQLKEMETDYEDNYTKRVYIHPAEAYQHPSEPQPSTNFDRTIEKMQKAIRQHSIKKKPKKKSGKGKDKKYKEWMKREEYNPFLHNAWLMMGKAQYMNGDFMTAAATFHYITGHFKWLPEVVVESRLWEAQCYNALEWTADADNIISRIKEKDLTSGDLRALYNLSMANYQIKVDSAEAALPYLRKAIDHYGGAQKVRLRFLYGQLCAESGRNSEAYMAFKKVNGANGATYRTKFNARIKQSEVYTGHDIEKEVKSLRSMVKYDRNKDYLDQIYYAIGNLYLSRQDTVRAIENYVLAAEESTRNGIEKAISQLTLGAIYFKQGRYDLAQPCYAEAVPIIGEEYAGYDSLKKRSDVLDILAQLYGKQKDYDSMLGVLERMETLEGENEDLTLAKMRIYSLQGKKEEEFNELKTMSAKHPNDMGYRVMMGNWLLQNGEPEEAYRQYEEVLRADPENVMARMSMIDYYKASGQVQRADSLQEEMLVNAKTPVDGKMALMRQVVADNEKQGGDSTEVINLFKKILAQPQETSDMAELYAAYMTLKQMPQDSISRVLETVLAISPDNVGARLQLIQSVWTKQDFDGVVELSRQGLDYNPDEMAFYYFLGLAYVQKDDDDNALETFRKGVGQIDDQSNPELVSDFYAIIGDILHEKGLDKEAYAAYDSCLQWKDDNLGCLNNYAYYLSEKNTQLEKAAQMSYRTVQAEPDNSTFLDTYAWILFKQGKYAEAAQYIDMAVKNDTTESAVIIEHAGDIHALNGDIDGALEYWQKALEIGTENDKALRRKIKLKKYVEDK